MIKHIYAVYDKKAEIELGLFEQPNDLVALRDFSQICQNKDSQIAKFADDYELVHVGEIDTQTNIITAHVRVIAQATDYVTKTVAND